MAGNYPDPVGPRMPYDRDGTVVALVSPNEGWVTVWSSAATRAMNDEAILGNSPVPDAARSGSTQTALAFVFPELRDVTHYFLTTAPETFGPTTYTVEVSADTTNGLDGVWTQIQGSLTPSVNQVFPFWRTATIALTGGSAVRGIRLRHPGASNRYNIYEMLHLYGKPSGATNRLEFWRPVDDLAIEHGHLDWGNRARSTSATKVFRIKNLSDTLTAQDITVGMEALRDSTSPTFVSQHSFRSPPGSGGYTPTILLSDPLSPGEISPQIEIKQDLLSNATLGLWAQRLYAQAATWL